MAAHSSAELVKPESIFVGTRDRHVDPKTVDEVWKQFLKLRDALLARGFAMKFAQSTYHHKGGRRSLSVDFTVADRGGNVFSA